MYIYVFYVALKELYDTTHKNLYSYNLVNAVTEKNKEPWAISKNSKGRIGKNGGDKRD